MSDVVAMRTKAKSVKEARKWCQMLGHSWWLAHPDGFVRKGKFVFAKSLVHLECSRCHTCRHDGLNADGELVARDYVHPDGYLLSKDEEPLTMQSVRQWVLKRDRAMVRKRAAAI